MYEVQSTFIKNKIKGLKRTDKNKKYVEDLIYLERYILGKLLGGMGGAMLAFGLKDEYAKEYELIYNELKPQEFKAYKQRKLKEEKKDREEEKQFLEEERKEEEKAKKEWVRMGGKL